MPGTIHIVEPTLTSQAGHCYSFIDSFCRAGKDIPMCIWANHNADVAFAASNIQIRRHFYSKIRRFQCFGLYRRLLKMPGKIFISTAGLADLVLMNWASRANIPPAKVYFYFHWFNISDKKRVRLAKIARQQPGFVILGPTRSVIDVFREAGFNNAMIAPYPISGLVQNAQAGQDRFLGLLYAGAARQDKGISHVVDLIEHMGKLKLQIPVKLQSSPDHRGKYDEATRADIDRLGKIAYPALQIFPETFSAEEYANLFVGAICVQLYSAKDFADRISGVTLDALSAGSPIVTTAGTWIARTVQRFNAGLVVGSTAPEEVLDAVQKIIANFPEYNQNAYRAGLVLQQENSADFLFRAVAGGISHAGLE